MGDPTLNDILSNSDHTFDLAVSTTQCKHSHIKRTVRLENHCVWETSSTSRLGKKRGVQALHKAEPSRFLASNPVVVILQPWTNFVIVGQHTEERRDKATPLEILSQRLTPESRERFGAQESQCRTSIPFHPPTHPHASMATALTTVTHPHQEPHPPPSQPQQPSTQVSSMRILVALPSPLTVAARLHRLGTVSVDDQTLSSAPMTLLSLDLANFRLETYARLQL